MTGPREPGPADELCPPVEEAAAQRVRDIVRAEMARLEAERARAAYQARAERNGQVAS